MRFHDGRYDLINDVFYEQMRTLFSGTKYAAIADFFLQRDTEIAKNIIKIIEANKGKTIVIVTGADHRSFILYTLKWQAALKIKIQ